MRARWTSALAVCSAVFAGACRSHPQEPERLLTTPDRPAERPPTFNPPAQKHSEPIRVGVAAGYLGSAVSVELDSPIARDPEIEDDYGWGGFVEIIAADTVHVRCTGVRSDHDVQGSQTSARVNQAALLAMVPFPNAISEHVTVAPLFGLGIGYADVDLDPPLGISGQDGVSLLFAAACEAEIAGHAFLGAMLTAGVFGDPGDTEGTTGSVLFYAGLRF